MTASTSLIALAVISGCSPAGTPKSEDKMLASTGGDEGAATQVIQEFGISRYAGVALSESEADLILAAASNILEGVDDPEDVPCPVVMRRQGSVSTFTTARGVISTKQDLIDVLAQPGSVHIVVNISACGKQRGGIKGCAPIPGADLAVIRISTALEGSLWAHEFGHNQGRGHRAGDKNVMDNAASELTRGVNAEECAAFMKPHKPSLGGSTLPSTASTSAKGDVGVFVRRVYFDGVPFADASSFTPNDLPSLSLILSNSEDRPYWDNAVSVMGAIGGQLAREQLIQFVRRYEDKVVDPDTFRAGLSAMIGIAYAANKGDKPALDFLIERARQFPATAPPDGTSLRLDQFYLNQSAVLALSLTAQPQADQMLRRLPDGLEVVQDAREMSDQVRLKGLQKFDSSN